MKLPVYEYNGVEDQIDALFANESKTKLAEGVDEQTINQLREQLNATQDFYIDSDILKDELNLAEQRCRITLLHLGIVMDGIQSRDTTGDVRVLNTPPANWSSCKFWKENCGLRRDSRRRKRHIGTNSVLCRVQFLERNSNCSAEWTKCHYHANHDQPERRKRRLAVLAVFRKQR